MITSLSGRTAIVTGAGRGIGRSAARLLSQMGASVVVNDIGASLDGLGRDIAPAEAVVREIRDAGGQAVANLDSVSEWDGAGRIVEAAVDSFGGVDILVNNAGLTLSKPIWEIDPELFERVCDTSVKGTFFCTRRAAPHMMAAGWGRIVNLVSRAGLIGIAGCAAYAAGKGGVFGLTNVCARDLAPHGITVNAVNPSSTETRMVTKAVEALRVQGGEGAAQAEDLMKAMQKPDDVGVLIASLCSEEAASINGQVFLVEKQEIGLFAPLTIGQRTSKPGVWSVDELVAAIGELASYPLDTPYGR